MNAVGQVYVYYFAEVFVVLCLLNWFSFVAELTIIAGNELGFPDI